MTDAEDIQRLDERIRVGLRQLAAWKRAVLTWTDAAAIAARKNMINRREIEVASLIEQREKLAQEPRLL